MNYFLSLFLVWFWLQRLHFSPCYQGFHDTRYVIIILFGGIVVSFFFCLLFMARLLSPFRSLLQGIPKALTNPYGQIEGSWSVAGPWVFFSLFCLISFVWCYFGIETAYWTPINSGNAHFTWMKIQLYTESCCNIHCLGFLLRLKLCWHPYGFENRMEGLAVLWLKLNVN